jgi:hypothetical protein
VSARGRKRREGVVAATLAVGLLLLLGGIALTLRKSGIKETGSNRVRIYVELGQVRPGATLCQANEVVPAGTGAVRPFAYPATARRGRLRVAVRADADGRIVASGSRLVNPTGDVTLVPVHPTVRRDTSARVCVTALDSPLAVGGARDPEGSASIGAHALGGDMRIVYLQPRPRSWWSFAPTVIERMGAGRRVSGTAVAIVVLLLSTAAIALAGAQLVRGRP